MSYRYHGRAAVDPQAPRAWGICDRCGFLYNLAQLRAQADWRGPTLQVINIMVCDICYDRAQEQGRAVVLPADPEPVSNPRPAHWAEEGDSYITTEQHGSRVGPDNKDRIVQQDGRRIIEE